MVPWGIDANARGHYWQLQAVTLRRRAQRRPPVRRSSRARRTGTTWRNCFL